MIPDVDPLDLVDPERFARNGYPHAVWTRLRAEAPVAHFAPPGLRPFWAITKHADIGGSCRSRRASNARIILGRHVPSSRRSSRSTPRHGPMRLPEPLHAAPPARRADIERIAAQILDEAATGGATSECDFVERIAAPLPIAVISWILGVPREDWRLLFRWTNEVIGHDDPEFRGPGETPADRRRARVTPSLPGRLVERRSDPGTIL
jgi:cytochrome P450